ncbi:SMI1/KNR4 family protein [Elizabethkingia anophelis]|uniref:Knr4/Smi1-like domain-containing protein n=2 Tax=Elizabethkingia anophelis TaxID=1117645 RepID=A0A077EM11_9FLAO|nr:SMI1/KNR4 family protein [Elizabethkingia anophelis]AIL47269.1 hypothetical protein BD94_3494 [Elizabethkingia anophelis NUHP1]MBE9395498.1 SMI1/KNR4 family protein [Elizabethkingia anophelis]MBE9408240.1 SMI1/KNR4 family protein [Elizabethkingia anophelis]MCT4013761.1 SMI1/KNR4 family protein [Elizabethkingia anophelis]MCT4206224.1 SMI1/KNR4 family protein [Elizabethkingia anophelis]
MELEYLKRLEEYYKNTPKVSKIGVSIENIENLEKELHLKFPKAYKEFLYLSGKRDNILGSFERGFENLESIQELAKSRINLENLSLKQIWCFAEYNDADSFMFFFLNNEENPPVYSFIAEKGLTDNNDKPVSYLKFRDSFSEYIEGCIDEALKKKF